MNDTILLAMSKEEFNEVVEKALKDSLGGYLLALATSPLAQSSLVEASFLSSQTVTSTARGSATHSMLRWGIDKLRPNGQHSWIAPSWRSYNILDSFYMKGSRVAEVAEKMGISRPRFYGLRPQAIEQLAELLHEELGAGLTLIHEWKQYAIADRYASRPNDEQRLLRMAAILRYPVSITLIHKMWGLPFADKAKWKNVDIQASIHNLVVVGMLVSDDHGIEILVHPEISQYLLTLLSPQERNEWHRAAGIYYEEQQQNYLEAAHHFYLTNGWKEQAAKLIINHYQNIVDNLQLEELYNLQSKFCKAQMNDYFWRRLKLVGGQVAELMAEYEKALAEYGKALGAKDVHIQAEAYYRRGKVLELQNLDESLAHYVRGIELLEKNSPQEPLLAKMYIDSAWIFMQELQELDKATTNLKRAEQFIPPQAQAIKVELHNAWAKFYQHNGEAEKTASHRWKAWVTALALQDVNLMINTAHNLGVHYCHTEDFEKALEYLGKSRDLAIKANNRKIEGACNSHIGAGYFYLGKYEEARNYYQMAYDFFLESGNYNWQGYASYNLAEVHIELGNHKLVLHYFENGIKIAEELQHQQLLKLLKNLKLKYPHIFNPPRPLQLNQRQLQALNHVKEQSKITNREHRELTGAAQKTAARDLKDMVEKGILTKVGKGPATRYVLAQKEESGK